MTRRLLGDFPAFPSSEIGRQPGATAPRNPTALHQNAGLSQADETTNVGKDIIGNNNDQNAQRDDVILKEDPPAIYR